MARRIPEKDWQIFRKVHPVALERFSEQIIKEVEDSLLHENQSAYERYVGIYKLIKDRDRELGYIFNDYRRSTAWRQIGIMHSYGLITPEELEQFSEETQEVINFLS